MNEDVYYKTGTITPLTEILGRFQREWFLFW